MEHKNLISEELMLFKELLYNKMPDVYIEYVKGFSNLSVTPRDGVSETDKKNHYINIPFPVFTFFNHIGRSDLTRRHGQIISTGSLKRHIQDIANIYKEGREYIEERPKEELYALIRMRRL